MATEVKQRNNRVFVLVGVVLALVAFALSLYISRSGSNNNGSSSGSQATADVVVAAVNIPKGTKIATEQLTTIPYNVDSVPPGSYSKPELVVGKYTAVDVAQKQPLVTGVLAADLNTATTIGSPDLPIRDGYVALAIPTVAPGTNGTNELTTVGCFIKPDDHIDILIDPGGPAGAAGAVRYGFQDVHVLRIGTAAAAPAAGASTGGCAQSMVVELPRAQAEQLAFLVNQKGGAQLVKYVLRPRKEYGKPDQPPNYEADGDPNVPKPADAVVTQDTFNKIFPKP